MPENIKPLLLKKAFKSLVRFVLASEHCICETVNIYFCSDSEIRKYNKSYLKHDYETDIITFNYSDSDGSESDIIISLETVKRNSLAYKSSYLIELFRVVIHGILHLAGMDDNTKGKKALMRKRENYYLKTIGLLK